ncbi:hypothetical protein SBF1_1420004 [Candidatus Desulfosporosinus infrequens]|uniref:Uncharacterized protein n=1 Tax=Candidatus Desulfosporosinus infrequens TaxID=2043169 RepID=A0A2U3K5U5_9FIRM|nr:hypothetical protein SBF1_1420004 [Candidatus Desulfosporosinus infrequens]
MGRRVPKYLTIKHQYSTILGSGGLFIPRASSKCITVSCEKSGVRVKCTALFYVPNIILPEDGFSSIDRYEHLVILSD